MLGMPQTLSSGAGQFALWAEQSSEYVSSFLCNKQGKIVDADGRPLGELIEGDANLTNCIV